MPCRMDLCVHDRGNRVGFGRGLEKRFRVVSKRRREHHRDRYSDWSAINESRKCDIEARRRLGPRGSSVFPTPVRLSLEAVNYTAACLASYESCGKRLSKQAFALVPRIREVDEILALGPHSAIRFTSAS